jgi:hypothetical protein
MLKLASSYRMLVLVLLDLLADISHLGTYKMAFNTMYTGLNVIWILNSQIGIFPSITSLNWGVRIDPLVFKDSGDCGVTIITGNSTLPT